MSHKTYPTFTTQDTLTQLVDKIVTFTEDVAGDIETVEDFDSDINAVFNASTGVLNFSDNFSVLANNGNMTFDSDLVVTANSVAFNSNSGVTIQAGDAGATKYNFTLGATNTIILESENDFSNIALKSGGVEYGSFNNNDGNLTINSAGSEVISLNGTTFAANFKGEIGLPQSGSGSPGTTSKTVAGAIDELRAAIIFLNNGTFPQ